MDAAQIKLEDLILAAYEAKASDLFIKGGQYPMMKQYSEVSPLMGDWPLLDPKNAERILRAVMSDTQQKEFDRELEFDLGIMVPGKCRVRVNIYSERGNYASVCRVVPLSIPTLEDLGLPPILRQFTTFNQGLVLVTGPTGCGKTTTLAVMLDLINQSRKGHIVTIEDPLEFVHQDKQCYVSQRELGIDTHNYNHALRATLRQAPDIILIGEMRDTDTMNVALQAGETGHLVFSTVHTASAYETLDRVINMFPPHEKHHICQRMANSLRGVIAQKLVPRADGKGRVVCNEILVCTPTVSKMIEDGAFHELYSAMKEGHHWGMQTMNESLIRYVGAGVVDADMAMKYAGIASELKQALHSSHETVH
ncbi:MAG TPA: PilT/PilU family type 4a pilus ATPase [Fimbriimonadaceae bacterium]|jgi:twitching motility protein PilT